MPNSRGHVRGTRLKCFAGAVAEIYSTKTYTACPGTKPVVLTGVTSGLGLLNPKQQIRPETLVFGVTIQGIISPSFVTDYCPRVITGSAASNVQGAILHPK